MSPLVALLLRDIERLEAELAKAVPDGWHVVNPRYMKELKRAETAADRVRDLIADLCDCGDESCTESAYRVAIAAALDQP